MRQLVLLGAALACAMATLMMVSMFVPLYAVTLGASPAVVGLLVSLNYLIPMFLALSVGGLVDRIGSKGPLGLSALLLVLAPIVVWAQPSITSLALLQVMAGIAHLVFVVSAQRFVSDLGRGARAERNFGWYSTFQSAGQMAGPLLGGLLIDLQGRQGAFLGASLLAVLAVVLTQLLRPTRTEARSEVLPATSAKATVVDKPRRAGPGRLRGLLANPGMRMAIAISCGVLVAQSVGQTFLPLYLDQLSFSATTIGFLISLRGFMSMMVRPFMPVIVRSLGGRATSAMIMVLVLALGLGMTGFVDSLLPLMVASLLVGLGAGITQPLSIVTVTDHVAKEEVGLALGMRLTWNRLAQVSSPAIIGLVAQFGGLSWAFVAAASTLLVTAGLILHWRGTFERAERALVAEG